MAVEHLERLHEQVVRILEAVGMGQDLPVGELLGRLALARRGGRQPGEHALGVGLRAAGQEAEAVELRREVVEQEARRGARGRLGGQPAGAACPRLQIGECTARRLRGSSTWSGPLDT